MTDIFDYDLFVIGAGSGGVRASRIAASHGARIAIAEEYRIGGTCVIRGCVPKKLLVYAAQFAQELSEADRFGWDIADRAFNWDRLRDAVSAEVTRLEGLYSETLNNNKVDLYKERATLTGPNTVTLADGRTITAKTILIATGGWPVRPDIPGAEFGITSNEVFHLKALPKRVLIAGGGYIANEFAGIFHEFGSEVTIVNRSDTILRGYDEEIRDRLLQISQAKGIAFKFNSTFERIAENADGSYRVTLAGQDPFDTDLVLFATGRAPNSNGLGLEALGVALDDQGAIHVDVKNQTNIPSIYAVGDVTNRVQLTPVAIREGHAFADTVFGNRPWQVDYDMIPNAVFSNPPIAGVGMTETEARKALADVVVYRSNFRPMKYGLAGRDERALYKMVCDAATDRVVGLHMIGPDSAEILQAAAVAVKAGLTKADFDATVALHPTMAEELVLLK